MELVAGPYPPVVSRRIILACNPKKGLHLYVTCISTCISTFVWGGITLRLRKGGVVRVVSGSVSDHHHLGVGVGGSGGFGDEGLPAPPLAEPVSFCAGGVVRWFSALA